MDFSWIQIVEDAVVPVGVAVVSYYLGRYDRERSRKERYQITTTRWQPYGLRLDIRYTPSSAHDHYRKTLRERTGRPMGHGIQGSRR